MRYLINDPVKTIWDQMDDLFEGSFGKNQLTSPAVDIREEKDAYVIEADLPGFSKDDVDLKIEENMLTISADVEKKDKSEEKDNYIKRERIRKNFQRSFALPKNVDPEKISAYFEEGVLYVELAKTEEKKPLSIKIGDGKKKMLNK